MAIATTMTYRSAATELAARDRVIAEMVDAIGLPSLRRPQADCFAALCRSILYQQLAGRAAAAIHARLVETLNSQVTPEAFSILTAADLRIIGISNNKALALLDLAEQLSIGTLNLDRRYLSRRTDEEIIAALCAVRGIGRWTAQMFLMFHLRRLNVWPAGDLGVRRGYALAWGGSMPTERELEPLGRRFAPYRSVAAWYCWRACELFPERSLV